MFLFMPSFLNAYLFTQEKKISRPELIRLVRKIAGDKLLISVIKQFRAKVWLPFLKHENSTISEPYRL